MKAFKAFIKPFKSPERSVKIKIQVNFYFDTTLWKKKTLKLIFNLIQLSESHGVPRVTEKTQF